MQGQLLHCSFSVVDIGFCSITFADALISLEFAEGKNCKIPVKGLGQTQCFFFLFHIK